jgi:MerR family transcriptional regulator, light-induced transcriptional regulator
MNETYYQQLNEYLNQENKDAAVSYALSLLTNNALSLEELYQSVLTPALNLFVCPIADREVCIWKEHARTAIVRTILECTYPELIKRVQTVKPLHQSVLVVCPAEEYHEVGALIVANFFQLAGFTARFIGANTPKADILSAVKVLKPNYIAISVTNFYNVIQTKQITRDIHDRFPDVKIILGGTAFLQKSNLAAVEYDYHLTSFEDIQALAKGLDK